MFFPQGADANSIIMMIKPKLEAVVSGSAHGVDIEIKRHVKRRSIDQNAYLWAIYAHIVKFFDATGFIPDNLPVRFINSDFLHEYFKMRFDVKETKKLNTAEFSAYTDKIQHLMLEQTNGDYDPIYPESTYQTF